MKSLKQLKNAVFTVRNISSSINNYTQSSAVQDASSHVISPSTSPSFNSFYVSLFLKKFFKYTIINI